MQSLFNPRYIPDLVALILIGALQAAGAWYLLRGARESKRNRAAAVLLASYAVLIFGFLLRFARVNRFFPLWFASWGRGLVILYAMLSVAFLAVFIVVRVIAPRPEHSPARRAFLRASQSALAVAPLAAAGYGVFIQRFDLRLEEQDIFIPGLPEDLNGLRLAQLSDIHLSPFLSVAELDRAIAMANEARPHLTFVTGDLTTSISDPLDRCLERLAMLKSDAGVFGCMGNHEIYTNSEDHVERAGARMGMRFLRAESALLRFGRASLNLVGFDYQKMHEKYLVGGERLVQPDSFNLLLSHNPDVFPVAAQQGYQLTLAGHMHGGQVRFEILRQDMNIARFFTPYVYGRYGIGGASLFVTRGIGTIGLPARLGAPPEVALLRLCRI